MKLNIPPSVLIAVCVLVVLGVGVLAYRTFFKDPYASPLSGEKMKEFEAAKARSAIHQNMGGGQMQGGMAPGGRGMHSQPMSSGGAAPR